MGQKNNGKSAAAFKLLACVVFILLVSETAFAQVSGLALDIRKDIRIETVCSYNTVVGYNLYVRKKPGMESVMLTDSTGNYALRTLVKYETNDAMRNLSGKRLTDTYSRFSIISSSPIPDCEFERGAFKLFIPSTVVYGNPSSACGPVCVDVLRGIHFNIRTFDQKYGDPNKSRFQNNFVTLGALAQNTRGTRHAEFASAYPSYNTADSIRRELSKQVHYDEFLSRMSYDELKELLLSVLLEKSRGGI
ncbi:MAG: hypothetical protein LBQ94_10410 [Treponema sp.]|jgi:hypothetical protein|nr:hypothetical protein [Treponema sp.]